MLENLWDHLAVETGWIAEVRRVGLTVERS
jgi:hypothetical protein